MQSPQNENKAPQLPNESSAAAAMKNEGNEISYDIFKWFPADGFPICQNVFKYLGGKDLIQASGVSKDWYKLVAERSQMKKLKLVFKMANDEELDDETKDILLNSKRQYENAEIVDELLPKTGFYLPLIVARAGSWKTLSWKNCSLKEGETWSELFHALEPTIEEILISAPVFYSGKPVNFSDLKFPHLKSLSYEACFSDLSKYFARCQTLVKFSSNSMHGDASVILRNNPGLKDVHVGNEVSSLADAPDYKFKLQKLEVRHGLRGIEAESIFPFLETQADSLESLNINIRLNQAVLELILNMPRLSSLGINFVDVSAAVWRGTEALPVSWTITSFEIDQTFFLYQSESGELVPNPFPFLFRAMPSLKHFKSNEIDDLALLSLARLVPGLETMEAKYFNAASLPEGDIFPNIKQFKAESFHEKLQKPTGENKFATLVAEQMNKPPPPYKSGLKAKAEEMGMRADDCSVM